MCLKTLNLHSDEWNTLSLHINKHLGAYGPTHPLLWLIFPYRWSVYAQKVCFEHMVLVGLDKNSSVNFQDASTLRLSELSKYFSIDSATCYFVGFNNIPINIYTA